MPAASMTWATTCAVPLTGRAVVAVVSVMLDPVGARSGPRWQASIAAEKIASRAGQMAEWERGIMKALSILIHMHLEGQGQYTEGAEKDAAGYAMAALIVGLAVMAVMMTVAMPVWKQTAQREKEEELVFRGEQIARSIGLFQRKFANAYPPTLDLLVEQKFLRKKYKDPITGGDFVPLTQAQQQAGTPGASTAGPGAQPAQGQRGTAAPGNGPLGLVSSGTPGGAPPGGIIGVTSKSTDVSIRLYKGRSHYNEWAFVYTPPPTAGGGTGQPGQRGGPGRGRGPVPGGGGRGAFGPGGPGGGPPAGAPPPFPVPLPPPPGPGSGR